MKQIIERHCKYINFQLVEKKPKTNLYICANNKSGAPLGWIKWFPGWRQYCFFAESFPVFSADCLDDISEFLKDINKIHKIETIKAKIKKREMMNNGN